MRPKLLFISPVVPAFTGLGGAMRCGYSISALCEVAHVTLVLLFREGVATGEVPERIRTQLQRLEVVRIPEAHPTPRTLIEGLQGNLRLLGRSLLRRPLEMDDYPPSFVNVVKNRLSERFDGMHVYRLRASQFALRLADELDIRPSKRVLDLDDIESKTHLRLADTRKSQLGRLAYWTEVLESKKFRRAEICATTDYSTVLVCSSTDREYLSSFSRKAHVEVLPNVYEATANLHGPQARPASGAESILFVGSLDYPPNQDAVRLLAREIAPRIRDKVPSVRLKVAGRRPPHWLHLECVSAGIELVADPASMDALYADACVVVVPLLSGGGTRIKILEAFAFGVPVVSTYVGAEGIDVQDDNHLLLADSAEEFASAVARLLVEPESRRRLQENGRKLLEEKYVPAAMTKQLAVVHGCEAHPAG